MAEQCTGLSVAECCPIECGFCGSYSHFSPIEMVLLSHEVTIGYHCWRCGYFLQRGNTWTAGFAFQKEDT